MLSDGVLVGIIAAVPGTLGVLLGLLNRGAIKDVHISLNSRLTELLNASVDSGRIAERDAQRQVDATKQDDAALVNTGRIAQQDEQRKGDA